MVALVAVCTQQAQTINEKRQEQSRSGAHASKMRSCDRQAESATAATSHQQRPPKRNLQLNADWLDWVVVAGAAHCVRSRSKQIPDPQPYLSLAFLYIAQYEAPVAHWNHEHSPGDLVHARVQRHALCRARASYWVRSTLFRNSPHKARFSREAMPGVQIKSR